MTDKERVLIDLLNDLLDALDEYSYLSESAGRAYEAASLWLKDNKTPND